jgi:hypothetical protein
MGVGSTLFTVAAGNEVLGITEEEAHVVEGSMIGMFIAFGRQDL